MYVIESLNKCNVLGLRAAPALHRPGRVGGLLSPARQRHTEKEHVALTGSAEAGRRETRRGRPLPVHRWVDAYLIAFTLVLLPHPALPEHVRCPRRARCRRRWASKSDMAQCARTLDRAPPARTPDARRPPSALAARRLHPTWSSRVLSAPPPDAVSSDLGSLDVIYARPQPSLPTRRTCERVWSLQRF